MAWRPLGSQVERAAGTSDGHPLWQAPTLFTRPCVSWC